MKRPDYYELLDARPDASPAELKQAYYRQAKIYHPDLNVGRSMPNRRGEMNYRGK